MKKIRDIGKKHSLYFIQLMLYSVLLEILTGQNLRAPCDGTPLEEGFESNREPYLTVG
jgi:hypothetical protein